MGVICTEVGEAKGRGVEVGIEMAVDNDWKGVGASPADEEEVI
jgi:hypothetical protein